MLTNTTQLIEAYNKKQKELQLRRWKVAAIVALSCLGAAVVAVIAMFLSTADIFKILSMVFGGITVLLFVLSLILRSTTSEKPLFEFMYKAVVDNQNFRRGQAISYTPSPKDLEVVADGGMFPRMATRQIRFVMNVPLENGQNARIFDAYLYTQSSKSRYVYFDGLYIVYAKPHTGYFQLRTTGSPKLKGVSFDKTRTAEKIREFVETGKSLRIPEVYYGLFTTLRERYPKSKIYIGATASELHLGISNYPLFRKMKTCTEETIRQLSAFVEQIAELSKEIHLTVSKDEAR